MTWLLVLQISSFLSEKADEEKKKSKLPSRKRSGWF